MYQTDHNMRVFYTSKMATFAHFFRNKIREYTYRYNNYSEYRVIEFDKKHCKLEIW